MLRVILLISTLIYAIAFLISCGGENAGGDNGSSQSSNAETDDTISFSDISYSRPDTAAVYVKLSVAAALVRNSKENPDRIFEAVKDADKAYSSYLTMYSYAELMHNKDCSNTFFGNEYDILSKSYSDLYTERERLSYEILRSEYKDELSKIGFTDTATFKINDRGSISDDYFALISHEEKLKYSYQTLSERNVYITYDGISDTYSSTINRLRDELGESSQAFSDATEECHALYLEALTEQRLNIFLSLVSTRNLIAGLLGYDSYNDYAYDILEYGHTADEYREYAKDVLEYTFPVYSDLNIKIFNPYFKNNFPKFLDKGTLLTNLISIYKTMDSRLYSVFGSMISSGLCDVAHAETAKNNSSYVAYFNTKLTPFLFHKSFGDARDYLAFSYGFGNYFDVFTNKAPRGSSYEAELSARMLEMITLSSLFESLDTDESKYIYYYSMKNVMGEMVYGSILSLAEQAIYDMDTDELNRESIARVLRDLANEHSVNEPKISDIVRPEIALTPKALEAKTISLSYAARIYFDKSDTRTKLQIYEALIDRSSDRTPAATLAGFGIPSPFGNDAVMELSDKIFYSINGYHYYKNNNSGDSVA